MNYQIELEKIILNIEKNKSDENYRKPKLLLHSCCAPCSSYCLSYLAPIFDITVFYYNPNINIIEEYKRRVSEQTRFIKALCADMNVDIQFAEGQYDVEAFQAAIKGYENAGEGSIRCQKCFELRLNESAKYAKEHGFDFFTTTLTISPLKNAHVLNETGQKAAEAYGSVFLPSDFKKKEGYKKSIELSAKYDLYRQDYCGCIYSKIEMEKRRNEKVD